MNLDSQRPQEDNLRQSFHTARIHALQRDHAEPSKSVPASAVPASLSAPQTIGETTIHPLIHEVFRHLQSNSSASQDPLAQTWTQISQKTDALSAELALESELTDRLALVHQRINGLRRELTAQLTEAQKAADKLLDAATLCSEVSRLTQNKLIERLNLNR